VWHSYNGKGVIQGLDLTIASSEIVCLLGASGCGKTTALRIAAGFERQIKGTVRLGNCQVSGASFHHPPEKRNIGFLFQDFALFPHLTVLSNVAFGIRNSDKSQRLKLASYYLERVGMLVHAKKYPHLLSGGEQQRVALARALAPRPRIMLMDEPFSSLDTRLRDAIRDEALSILREENAAVLLVTHEPDEALRMADRIALMRDGLIVQHGEPYHVYNHPIDCSTAAFFSDINVIPADVRFQQADTVFGRFLTPGIPDGEAVEIVFRPQHLGVTLYDLGHDLGTEESSSSGSMGTEAMGITERARFIGAQSLVEVRMPHDYSLIQALVPGVFLPEKGTRLRLLLRRDQCFVFPKEKQGRRRQF
jgi:iron(III) transport system ATP-binding protein